MASHKIVATSLSTTTLAVTDGTFDPQTEQDVEGHGGSPLQGISSIRRHRPMAQLTFRDVGAALSLFGVSGYEISANDLEFWTAKRDSGGALKTTGNKIAFTSGLVVPTGLTAAHGELASIEYTAYGAASGSKPYSISLDGSVPDMSSVVTALWTLGPGTLNAADIGPLQNLNVDFSPQVQHEEGDGVIWPQAVYIDQWEITATVESEDPDLATDVDVGNENAITVQLSKKDGTGIASSGHRTVAFDQSLTTLDQVQGDSRSNATTTLRVTATSSDYSTFPVSIST